MAHLFRDYLLCGSQNGSPQIGQPYAEIKHLVMDPRPTSTQELCSFEPSTVKAPDGFAANITAMPVPHLPNGTEGMIGPVHWA